MLVRLALNPYALAYPMAAPIFNWLLYGYGVPALAFIVATRQFGSRADDLLVRMLEAGSLLLIDDAADLRTAPRALWPDRRAAQRSRQGRA